MVEVYYDTCSQYDGEPGWMVRSDGGCVDLDGPTEADAIRQAAAMAGVPESEVTVGETV